MHRPSFSPLIAAAVLVVPGLAVAQTPSAERVVDRAIAAAEPESTLAGHDMLRVAVRQEETAADGTTKTDDLTAVVHGGRLENIRVELGQGITLVLNSGNGWAMMRGEVDTRPQTPRMAAGTIRQTLFPLLLPFSLRMDGVRLGPAVTETVFDGAAAWVVTTDFDPDFFAAPSMLTTWRIFIDKDSFRVLGAEFLPAADFRSVRNEGIRYRVLKRQNVDGIELPAQILLDGIDLDGVENGHVRVTKIDTTTAGPLDLGLFIHPDERDRLDAGDPF